MKKLSSFITLGLLVLLTSGCETTRTVSGIGASAAGAFIGQEINSDYGGVAGSAVGLIGTELLYNASENRAVHEYNRGYDRGKADQMKQIMEGLEMNHLPGGSSGNRSTQTVILPEGRDEDDNSLVERKVYVPK